MNWKWFDVLFCIVANIALAPMSSRKRTNNEDLIASHMYVNNLMNEKLISIKGRVSITWRRRSVQNIIQSELSRNMQNADELKGFLSRVMQSDSV